jgi:hypothetical protein
MSADRFREIEDIAKTLVEVREKLESSNDRGIRQEPMLYIARSRTRTGSAIAFAVVRHQIPNWFSARMPKLSGSLPSVVPTERNRADQRDPAYIERRVAVETLKQRCRTEHGVDISGQDLRRVAGCREASELYKWLHHGNRDERFRAVIDLPTNEFVEKALRLSPKKLPRSQIRNTWRFLPDP